MRRVVSTTKAIVAAVVVVASAAVALPVLPAGPAVAQTATSAFEPVRPCRLADTRNASGFTRLDEGTIRIGVAGACGLDAEAVAATLTVTITEPRAAGFATVFPSGSARPLTTSGNVVAGETRATSTIARLGENGSIDVYLSMTAHVVVDVTGAFVPATTSATGRFVPFGPLRLADTRLTNTRVPAGGRIVVPLPSAIPSDTSALAVNVTITGTAGAGFVTAYPAGDALPPTSTVNSDAPGQTRSATVIVSVTAAGLALHASSATDVVVDLFGYFTGRSMQASSTGLFTPIDPVRVLDTRETSPLGAGVPLYPSGGVEVPLPGDQAIAAMMIAAVDAAPGFLAAYPAGTSIPGTASATISRPGETVANLAFAQRSDRGVGVYSHATSHVVIDLAGWFSGVTRTANMAPPTNVPPATSSAPPGAPPAAAVEYLPLTEVGCTRFIRVAAPASDAQRIGTSVEGRPIVAEHYGDAGGKPVLVVGPAHGDECSALAVVEQIRAQARDGGVPAGVHVVVIPMMNPDGVTNGTRRNANGVDLNKDGAAWSQPETKALMSLTAEIEPIASVHLHSPLSMVGGQSGPFGLGAFMAAFISDRTGISRTRTAGPQAHFLWGGQAQILPYMASVLLETPRGYPGEALGATGEVMPGPPASDELWAATARAVLDSFALV